MPYRADLELARVHLSQNEQKIKGQKARLPSPTANSESSRSSPASHPADLFLKAKPASVRPSIGNLENISATRTIPDRRSMDFGLVVP